MKTTCSKGEGVRVDGPATITYSSSHDDSDEIVLHVECADHVAIIPVRKIKVRYRASIQQVRIRSAIDSGGR